MAKKKNGTVNWPEIAARLLLGGVLFYAGFSKIGNAEKFAEEISHYKLLPAVGDRFVAVTLPWSEVMVGAMLILGIWLRATALVATALFGVFLVAVSSAIIRGYDIKCGCFGSANPSPLGYQTLAFDAVGLVLALFVYMRARLKRG